MSVMSQCVEEYEYVSSQQSRLGKAFDWANARVLQG